MNIEMCLMLEKLLGFKKASVHIRQLIVYIREGILSDLSDSKAQFLSNYHQCYWSYCIMS